ncbi:MAG TPA: hypothetical protein VFG34_09615 [Sphingopyxis sp.]|nr:hypothetical protein [Sphingopyxis sp.]
MLHPYRTLMASALLFSTSLAGCAADPATKTAAQPAAMAAGKINIIADAFVALSLEADVHEPGYVDAYYGPAAWRETAQAQPRSIGDLVAEARRLIAAVSALQRDFADDPMKTQRLRALNAQLIAAETRLQMMQGTRFSFADEAEKLFGVRPRLQPLASYDAVLQRLDKLLPGTAPLADRIEALSAQFTIPKDRLKPVFEQAIAMCRAKSSAHIAMPTGESFALSFVTDKSWSGYNYYQGDFHSKIEVNIDFPIRLPRALDLGCHEGYPGHHLLNMKLEEKLVRERGWREFSIYPLYSPLSLIAEGSANYGIRLAFPNKQQVERDIFMPLAGLPAAPSDDYWRIMDMVAELSGARLTIAQQYLDGEIDRAAALALSEKYLLLTPERADQSIRFTEQYRSYVINYGLGEAMVRQYIEAGGANEATKWRRMEDLLSQPMLPTDLLPKRH